ncbi:hypothetical protein DH86_00002401 [Scytalidium sp. 3C]|nr:hypothetical protein DH86_00002401 [Scytalidium sp. 3C]
MLVLFRSLKAAQASTKRAFTASANGLQQNVSKTNEVPTPAPLQDKALQESVDEGEKFRLMQEPNRAGTWSRNQQPRAVAMSGPRFEQTIMQAQANEHHRHHLESLPKESVAYPLEPQGNAAEVPVNQRITDEALGQR